MDRGKWDEIITRFQARARGYLTRTEVRHAREDFEEIVREIEGGVSHLRWTDATLSAPHFTDTSGSWLQPPSRLLKTTGPELDVSTLQISDPPPEKGQDHCIQPERPTTESADCSSIPVRGDVEEQGWTVEGGETKRTGRSSTIWSSPEQDIGVYPQRDLNLDSGLQQYCLAQNVPRTPQALRLHRNTLTMELVWIQQAIDSRKKYLSLRNRLSVS
ncbi:IQ domain-containing protein C isoform X1 [Cyprinodon tularosa]|uniref:IQ domain-containing protein C isoform X1 n=1 Tax=Cyprinodon tularosa TaxID=77115 RepID=UPI0018E247E7|nr:IQ domain-containing protein C isoform X1 [Cyprinodon tularosa]